MRLPKLLGGLLLYERGKKEGRTLLVLSIFSLFLHISFPKPTANSFAKVSGALQTPHPSVYCLGNGASSTYFSESVRCLLCARLRTMPFSLALPSIAVSFCRGSEHFLALWVLRRTTGLLVIQLELFPQH